MTPDYILIGAMKCGTTTLAAQLGAQPGIFMTEPKEPNFFSDDANFAKGMDWYSAHFAGAAPGDLKGEASTHYTKRPEMLETVTRLKAEVPQAKLVYMIRNPIARIVSHYIHEWTQGVLSAPLDVEIERHTPLVDYGRYGWQVAPFVEAFGREAIFLTSLERMKADPGGELTRVAQHIGFTGDVAWVEDQAAENVSAQRSRKLPMHRLLVDNPVANALRRTLVPKSVRNRVREARQYKGRPEIPAAKLPELQARFLADREILAGFFPGDPSLDLAYPFNETRS
ncbi:MAG: sulfotransferase domain-containing protein [Pseudomonadota bacterium]